MKIYLALIMIVLMISSVFISSAFGITEATDQTAPIEPEDKYVTFRGEMDKQNPEEQNTIKRFFEDLLSGQAFTFVTDSNAEKGIVQGKQCIGTTASSKFHLYEGGVNVNDEKLSAGKLCKNGEYIRYRINSYDKLGIEKVYQKDLFQHLWIKSNEKDILNYADFSWSSSGIFNNLDTNKLYVSYICYSCSKPIIKGCMNQNALNYNKLATVNEGCQFTPCEEKSTYTVSEGAKYYPSCSGTKSISYFSCKDNKLTTSLKSCSSGNICKDGSCVKEVIIAPAQKPTPNLDTQPPINENPIIDDTPAPAPIVDTTIATTGVQTEPTPQPTQNKFFDLEQYGYYTYGLIAMTLILLLVLFATSGNKKKRRR